jgi:peptidoglycan/LPS O-acetylase OafA/YrhL
VQKLSHLPSTVVPALPALGILAAAAGAYVIMKLYDEPVRRWLTARRGNMIRAPLVAGADLG